jgi:hypothetical protein
MSMPVASRLLANKDRILLMGLPPIGATHRARRLLPIKD